MTGFGDREDDGVAENATEVHELFARTVAEDRPRLRFTAEDLVLGGRRRVRRRRVAALLASTASIAAVAVAATAFAGGTGAASPTSDSDPALADAKLANAAIGELFSELDPGGHHLTAGEQKPDVDYFLQFGGGLCNDKTHVIESYGFNEQWTADGKAAGSRNSSYTSPFVQVRVSITVPGGQEGQFPASAGWGPVTTQTLSDGSVVRTDSTAGGHYLKATRTLSDKRQIVLLVEDASAVPAPAGMPLPKPTVPFPYTTQQLGAVLGRLSLPLPFADGYRAQGQCPPPKQ